MNTIFVKSRKLFLKIIKLKFVSNILNYYIRRYFYIFFIYDNLTFTIILVHGSFKTKIQMRVSQTPRHRLNFEFEITLVSSSMCFLYYRKNFYKEFPLFNRLYSCGRSNWKMKLAVEGQRKSDNRVII